MKRNIILLNLILIIINLSSESLSTRIGVPVLIWQKLNNHLIKNDLNINTISSQSSVNQISSNVLRDDYLLTKDKTIVAFIQNDLNVEQFSTVNQNQFKTINNIISDSTLEPLLLTDVLNPIEAMKDFRVEDISRLNVNNGNKIVINLPKNNLVENDELIGELVEKIRQNVTQNTLYLITGRHNPYNDLSDSHIEENHFGRHVLSAEDYSEILAESRKNTSEQLDQLVVVGDQCLYFYSSLLTVSQYNESIANKTIPIYTYDMKPVDTNSSKCWEVEANSTRQKEPAFLDLTYRNDTDKKSPILQLQLIIDSPFSKNKTDFWRISSGRVNLTEDPDKPDQVMEYDLIISDISSENYFSYSCSKLQIFGQITNTSYAKDITQILLVFNNFQLQPFLNPLNKNSTNDGSTKFFIFADSFDCEVWMTLPLWMGLLTILLFLIILFIGVYFLSEVRTPDRFENPKGKPLMITNFDE